MGKTIEIRDPIHGFIRLGEWERDIINHPIFQRLRRIRQLSLTDLVYPGAMHTRFEHSLGVMHVASRMFDSIVTKKQKFLKEELGFNDTGLDRDKALLRISCLLHDIGHSPFSHAGETLMPEKADGKKYKHEDYSAAAVTMLMQDVIDNHPENQNYNITAQEVSDFIQGHSRLGRRLLWRSLLSSQLDADRGDYLLRDSHHIGVAYGHYDLERILSTITVTTANEAGSAIVAVEYGGLHAAEALILARYMMFTQVYFHHTRRAYDHHLAGAIKHMLLQTGKTCKFMSHGVFPPPTTPENVRAYLDWTDWKVLGLLDQGAGGDDGQRLRDRNHDRHVFETSETPNTGELELIERITDKAGNDGISFIDKASSSWYKLDSDIQILCNPGQRDERTVNLSEISTVVRELKTGKMYRVYATPDKTGIARKTIEAIKKEGESQ